MSEEKLYWNPDTKITITGREFEAFARITELIDVPFSTLSTKQMIQIFGPASEAVRDVLLRMQKEGLLNDHSEAEVIPEN